MGAGLLGGLVDRSDAGAAYPVFNQNKRSIIIGMLIGPGVEPGHMVFGFPMPFQGEMRKPD